MKEEKYDVRITGFRNKAEAMAFIQWYEGQGEQDADVWFECRQDEGEIDCSSMHTDMQAWPPKEKDNVLTFRVKPM